MKISINNNDCFLLSQKYLRVYDPTIPIDDKAIVRMG